MVEGTTKSDQRGDKDCSDEIAEEYKEPVFEELEEADFAVEKSHEHEAIAGEKLATGNNYHGETGSKNAGAGDFATVNVAESGASSSKSDKHAGENAEKEHFPPFEVGFLLAYCDGTFSDFIGCEGVRFFADDFGCFQNNTSCHPLYLWYDYSTFLDFWVGEIGVSLLWHCIIRRTIRQIGLLDKFCRDG